MIYYLRYYGYVLWRWLRWPFCKWVRQGYCTIDEIIADWSRDPEMRKLMKDIK